jgi:hypothetical protein
MKKLNKKILKKTESFLKVKKIKEIEKIHNKIVADEHIQFKKDSLAKELIQEYRTPSHEDEFCTGCRHYHVNGKVTCTRYRIPIEFGVVSNKSVPLRIRICKIEWHKEVLQ